MINGNSTMCDHSGHESASFDNCGDDSIAPDFPKIDVARSFGKNMHLQKKLKYKFEFSTRVGKVSYCQIGAI